jgi:hypothetical protein
VGLLEDSAKLLADAPPRAIVTFDFDKKEMEIAWDEYAMCCRTSTGAEIFKVLPMSDLDVDVILESARILVEVARELMEDKKKNL